MGLGAKVVVVGAGSYVFGPRILHGLIVEHHLAGSEIVLVDIDRDAAERMAGVGLQMSRQTGIPVQISTATDWKGVLPGADFVVMSAAVDLIRRWEMDWEVAHRYGLQQAMGECGGVGGMLYAFRSVPLVMSLARDMERLSPQAWLLNVTNPLPRVLTAVTRFTRIRAVGFCNVAEVGRRLVAQLLHRPVESLEMTTAGLNHFAWFTQIQDAQTGEDLYPIVRQSALQSEEIWPLTRKWFRQWGLMPASGDSHIGEYLAFDGEVEQEHRAHHGTPVQRLAAKQHLDAIARGEASWESLELAWEKPADFIAAIVRNQRTLFPMLNVVNQGALSGLPDQAVVEVPVVVEGGAEKPQRIGVLPTPILELCRSVSTTHDLVAEAAVRGDRNLAYAALEVDPSITNVAAARQAVDELIALHRDVLPQFRD